MHLIKQWGLRQGFDIIHNTVLVQTNERDFKTAFRSYDFETGEPVAYFPFQGFNTLENFATDGRDLFFQIKERSEFDLRDSDLIRDEDILLARVKHWSKVSPYEPKGEDDWYWDGFCHFVGEPVGQVEEVEGGYGNRYDVQAKIVSVPDYPEEEGEYWNPDHDWTDVQIPISFRRRRMPTQRAMKLKRKGNEIYVLYDRASEEDSHELAVYEVSLKNITPREN